MTNTHSSTTGLILRVTLGTILLAHGLLKLTVFTPAGTVAYFGSLGLPPTIAYLTIFAEVAGGSALIVGVYTRLVAILSLPVLIGATWAHIGNGWVFSNEGGGWEFPALLLVLAITVAIEGAGKLAVRRLPLIDRLIPDVLKA